MDLLTIREAAKVSRMSESWWRQKIFRKQIRFVKIGSRVFVPAETVEELIENCVNEPNKPLVAVTQD